MRILYVEDEMYLAEAVIHLLKKSNIMVDWANDGERGLDLALKNNYDCIVLDIMLPKISGWEILQSLRQRKIKTPIIMLSALAEVDDKVRALNTGADDYLAKPFKTAELIARLQALTRRPPLQERKTIEFGDLVYDCSKHQLNDLELTAKEAMMLELFLQNSQQILPKERLLCYVWGDDEAANESYVEVYVSHLRKKFKDIGSRAKIVASRNLGYKLVEE